MILILFCEKQSQCLLKNNFELNWQLSEQYCTWYMISAAFCRLEDQNLQELQMM